RQRGIVVCVAAGNNDQDGRVEAPATSPTAIAVSVTFQYLGFELLAPYSSHGPEIWVAAPANFLWSTTKKSYAADYTEAYRLFNGTSAAAPFVAGVAALINAKYGSGDAEQDTASWADRVKWRLAETADDLGPPGFDPFYGHGRVNARRAITADW
ncbi:MAG: S8 family serine peptidase, partial [Cyanobacteria bacterium NC_groundwater_1444_Ag_S-0.65um_54_12]|nr:S8 family serine peptidase [Cyanobacteria bacterium NC_groundwater_1444_Ag_S-0.65um_54_12]